MTKVLFFVAFLSVSGSYGQTQITTVILLRHAEKGVESDDPDLNPAGKKRAESLVELLKKTKIDAIYSTPYKRTRNTVLPMAEARGLTVGNFNPSKMNDI